MSRLRMEPAMVFYLPLSQSRLAFACLRLDCQRDIAASAYVSEVIFEGRSGTVALHRCRVIISGAAGALVDALQPAYSAYRHDAGGRGAGGDRVRFPAMNCPRGR